MSLQNTNENILHPLQQRLEGQMQWVVQVAQNLSAQELHKKAPDGGWSIAACLWHLNSYYAYYLPLLKSSMRTDVKKFSSGWLGKYFTKVMEPNTHGKKYNAFKDHIPPSNLDGHLVVHEFLQYHEEMMALMEQAKKSDLNTRIPISITKLVKLKLGDVIGFISAHNERHLLQAKRNLSR